MPDLSPTCAREAHILRMLWRTYPHVSAEGVISGKGLESLQHAIGVLNASTPETLIGCAMGLGLQPTRC